MEQTAPAPPPGRTRRRRAAPATGPIEVVAAASPDQANRALSRARRHLLDWLRADLAGGERPSGARAEDEEEAEGQGRPAHEV